MDIRHLQYFIEVARSGSFTKAAQLLHVTQPTISKMVKNIEAELGVELLDRSGKKVVLTDAGEIIYRQADSIVRSFEQLSAELGDLMSLQRGNVRIGLPPMVGSHFFPSIIGDFRQLYPAITIHLVEDGANAIEAAVGDGTLDVGVIILPTNEEKFNMLPFLNDPLFVLLHPSHPLTAKTSLSLADLADEPFILFREQFALHDRIIAECAKYNYYPHIVCESTQWDFIREMVAANLGLTLLPRTICQTLDQSRIRCIPLQEQTISWHLALIWHKERYLSFAAKEWLRFARTALEQQFTAKQKDNRL
ncbi:LysR family transcriptional regulator [Paenibacillus sp. GCM10027626]|uniref:LysR family transcriptional regulator n=1 Tax=Paenibacillus sp. GCM10027626 TaxID=3273411 RepID=UPI00363D7C6E